jgi:hypothetical protein
LRLKKRQFKFSVYLTVSNEFTLPYNLACGVEHIELHFTDHWPNCEKALLEFGDVMDAVIEEFDECFEAKWASVENELLGTR